MNVLITLSMLMMSKISSDYLIDASPLFYVYLSHLFTNMLYYCFTPKSFCISTMIQKAQTKIQLTSETTEVSPLVAYSLSYLIVVL